MNFAEEQERPPNFSQYDMGFLKPKQEQKGSKGLNEYARWLWTPKLKEHGDSKCLNGQWLWMPKWRHDFERQTEKDDCSKCQTEDMDLNA